MAGQGRSRDVRQSWAASITKQVNHKSNPMHLHQGGQKLMPSISLGQETRSPFRENFPDQDLHRAIPGIIEARPAVVAEKQDRRPLDVFGVSSN